MNYGKLVKKASDIRLSWRLLSFNLPIDYDLNKINETSTINSISSGC